MKLPLPQKTAPGQNSRAHSLVVTWVSRFPGLCKQS